MPRGFLKTVTSLFLIVTILVASGLCSCLDSHAAQQSPAAAVAADCGGAGHCPACPGDDHSDTDHDAGSCFCACHLPLIAPKIEICYNPIVTSLFPLEKFSAIPEVFLPKFIPPQNLA